MIADLCRIYGYSIDHVLSMPMKQAGFLWNRGVYAERMQAARIAHAMNGEDLDAILEEKKERKRDYLAKRPSKRGQQIIEAMMKEAND